MFCYTIFSRSFISLELEQDFIGTSFLIFKMNRKTNFVDEKAWDMEKTFFGPEKSYLKF